MERMEFDADKYQAQRALYKTFKRLGIVKPDPMEVILEKMEASFGQPDTLYINPQTYERLKKLIDDKQSDAGSQADGDST